MNTALPEMLHCANPTVLDRLRARFKGNQQQLFQPHESFLGSNSEQFTDMFAVQSESLHGFLGCDSGLSEVVARSVKPFEASLEQEWPEFATFDVSSVEFGYGTNGPGTCQEMTTQVSCAISRTNSCPPAVAEAKRKESEKLSSAAGKESFTKRKADTLQNGKAIAVEEAKVKKLKGCAEEEESKITEKNSNKSTKNKNKGETSADNSKDNSKNSEVKKPDYIHVRARRGQATDSHSLAERVRREKISERMRYLQDLVPGCNKITGKAGMLDEIINYVQSLQRQVEFLSMKLASVNPKIDFNTDNFFAKGLLPPCGPNFPMMGMSTEIANHNPNTSYLQFNPVQEAISCCGVEIGVSPSDMGLRRTTSAPVSIPDAYFCSSSLPQIQPSLNWDVNLQNLYNMDIQGRLPAYGTQPFTGGVEASYVKMEI